MTEQDPNSIVQLLVQHEEAIASLYETCRAIFPDYAGFWNKLVMEEKAHAHVLKDLQQCMEIDQVFLNHRKFNATGINTAIDHVNKQKPAVEAAGCTMIRALAMALDIERAIIDRNFFEVFDTDSTLIKREFDELRVHTIEHTARIAELLNKLREA